MRILIILVSFMFLGQPILSKNINTSIEKTVTKKVSNYIITTGVAGYVPVMIMTAAELKEVEGENFGEFEVVIYGEAVKLFADKEAGQKLVNMAKASGAKIVLCDFALKHFKISKESLPEGLELVENAFTYNFIKQKEGYYVLGV